MDIYTKIHTFACNLFHFHALNRLSDTYEFNISLQINIIADAMWSPYESQTGFILSGIIVTSDGYRTLSLVKKAHWRVVALILLIDVVG